MVIYPVLGLLPPLVLVVYHVLGLQGFTKSFIVVIASPSARTAVIVPLS